MHTFKRAIMFAVVVVFKILMLINPRSLGRVGGGGVKLTAHSKFLALIFCSLHDQLSKALVQLFLVCEHIF